MPAGNRKTRLHTPLAPWKSRCLYTLQREPGSTLRLSCPGPWARPLLAKQEGLEAKGDALSAAANLEGALDGGSHVTPEQACLACGGATHVLLDAEQVRVQRKRAYRFHLRRLERRYRSELNERALFTHDEAIPVLECDACGLLARSPIPASRDVEHTYANDEYPPDRLVEMLATQVSLYRRKIPVLRRLLGEPRQILEVGSFVGGFLDVAHTAGWNAIGIDPGRQLAQWCRDRGLTVYACTLEEFALQHGVLEVDCLAIWNTFDQLADPRPTLALAADFVVKGGILAIRVPHGHGYRSLLARRDAASAVSRPFWEACLAWNNLLSFPHLYGNGIQSLDQLVTPYGFERVMTHGDVLGTISGRATAHWARTEEQLVKQTQLAWIRRQQRDPRSLLSAAPWLDVYWRRV